jgi:hypothetical protein
MDPTTGAAGYLLNGQLLGGATTGANGPALNDLIDTLRQATLDTGGAVLEHHTLIRISGPVELATSLADGFAQGAEVYATPGDPATSLGAGAMVIATDVASEAAVGFFIAEGIGAGAGGIGAPLGVSAAAAGVVLTYSVSENVKKDFIQNLCVECRPQELEPLPADPAPADDFSSEEKVRPAASGS